MPIEVFQDLEVHCKSPHVESFIKSLTGTLNQGWIRNSELEARVNKEISYSHIKAQYSFSCGEVNERKAATLWLVEVNDGLRVSNIVPAKTGRLSYAEYNYILNEFYNLFILPFCIKGEIEVNLGKASVTIDDWAKPETVRALKLFSFVANKSTGRGHPLDDARWMDFVITAHKVNDDLHSEDLRRWLVEEEKWFDEIAWDLCGDYEYGRQLLKKYEQS